MIKLLLLLAAVVPQVIPGTVTVRGDLDKDLILRVVRRHKNEVKSCYEAELAKNSNLQGRVVIEFTIDTTGTVTDSTVKSSTLDSPTVEECIAAAVLKWEFPRPKIGIAVITFPNLIRFLLKSSSDVTWSS